MVFALGSSVGNDVKWQSAIDRALGTWESVVEWADYISFLSRVQKAIKNNHRCDGSKLPLAPQISEILARCLEPSLPAGVHQTCLDVYDTVFGILGPTKLAETINLWLPGLLPVASWAAFNVKPLVVQLFAKYIVPAVRANASELHELYRPLLLSLLQSIENESSDCFSEINSILETLLSFSADNGDLIFWRCFYLCILSSPECRLGALTFLQKNTPDISETGLFIRSVCSGLEDSNVLVQRGFLDIMIKHLPLKSNELQRDRDDFSKLILSACRTILKKDMSLNRRLRLWLLGPEIENLKTDTNDDEIMTRLEYLQRYAADTLTSVLLDELSRDITSTCTIAQGLMDRWELGVTIAPALLTPVLRQTQESGNLEPGVASFFDNVESNIVWDTVIKLLDSHPETVLYMIEHFRIQDSDMVNFYIPLTVLYILADVNLSDIKRKIVSDLIAILPYQKKPVAPPHRLNRDSLRETIVRSFEISLNANMAGEESTSLTSDLSVDNLSWYLLTLAGDVMLEGGSADILNKTLQRFASTPGLELEIPHYESLIENLNTSSDGVELFLQLVFKMSPLQIRQYVHHLVSDATALLISNGNRQLERVNDLWQVHEVTDGLVVPSAISVFLADQSLPAFQRAKIFVGIWVHSTDRKDVGAMLTKPLLLFLDLELEDKSTFYAYLQSGLVRTGTTSRMIKLLVDKLDLESRNDDNVFSFVLEKFVSLLNYVEVRSAYVNKFAPLVCTLLLEWFDKSLLPEKAYSHALELAELTILDTRIKDGKLWLKRFVEALTHSYIDQEREKQDSVLMQNETDSSPVPVALIRFVTAAIPTLDQKRDIRLFIEVCIRRLKSEVDYEFFIQLLNSLLTSDPEVEDRLLHCIIQKLEVLDKPTIHPDSPDLGENIGVLHLIAALEQIMNTAFVVVGDNAPSNGIIGSGLTNAITGFQVESPEDRSRAEALQGTVLKCLNDSVAQCCKYWQALQRNRFVFGTSGQSEVSTAIHASGRLKTRLRKLMSLCYTSRPLETLKAIEMYMADLKLAVRMTHMFEGSRVGPTLEALLNKATETQSRRMFEYAAFYVDSLEIDVLSDVWPVINQFLVATTSTTSFFSSSHLNNAMKKVSIEEPSQSPDAKYGILEFLTLSIVPRFDQLKLRNRKKFARELADVYSKHLMSDVTKVDVVIAGIKQIPIVISDTDRQASVLGKILNNLLKSPQDVAEQTELLRTVSATFGIAGTSTAKVWTRHIGDFIFETRTENSLMPVSLNKSIALKPVIKTWVQCDKEKVKDFISKLPTYGSSTGVLFGWSGTKELTNANLNRLTYLTVCTPPTILGINWSKLTNQLATLWEDNAAAVCTLLRACILNEPPATLVGFIAYRLQSVFNSALQKKAPVSGEEADLLLEACKLVDLALVIGAEQFQLYGWLFISDDGSTVYKYGLQKNEAQVDNKSEKAKQEGSALPAVGGILERLIGCPAFPKVPVAEQMVAPSPVYKGKRRPLLPERASLEDLPMFLSQVSLSNYEEMYSRTVPDRAYCEKWLLADLFD